MMRGYAVGWDGCTLSLPMRTYDEGVCCGMGLDVP